MPSRRRSREIALQMMYQWEAGGEKPRIVVKDFFSGLNPQGPQPVDPFAEQLFLQAVSNSDALDKIIQTHSKEWSLKRLSLVMRSLLRLSLEELRRAETPVSIVINETIEIGRRFEGDKSTAFLNGILDAYRKEIQLEAAPPQPTQN